MQQKDSEESDSSHRSFYDTTWATLWQDQPLTSLLRSLPPDVYKDGNKAREFVSTMNH